MYGVYIYYTDARSCAREKIALGIIDNDVINGNRSTVKLIQQTYKKLTFETPGRTILSTYKKLLETSGVIKERGS